MPMDIRMCISGKAARRHHKLLISDRNANGNGTAFTELPGSLHGNACGIVYADGHSDVHIWKGSKTTPQVTYITYLQNVSVTGDIASQNDLTWLAQHTPAN